MKNAEDQKFFSNYHAKKNQDLFLEPKEISPAEKAERLKQQIWARLLSSFDADHMDFSLEQYLFLVKTASKVLDDVDKHLDKKILGPTTSFTGLQKD